MTKRPSYQWYPGDFKRDTALQACSFEARSLWREMLDLMHDGEPYGHLTAGGVAIQDSQLARMVGIPVKKCTAWLFELQERGVFSRTDKGVIYSRRMIKDGETYAEWIEKSRRGGQESARKRASRRASKRASKEQPPLQPEPQPEANTAVCSLQSAGTTTPKTTTSPRAAPRENWLLPASRIWEARFGPGSFDFGKNGKHLKRLKPHHAPAEIAEHLKRFLEKADPAYVNVARFVDTFAEYAATDPAALVDEYGCLTALGERETRSPGMRVA